MKKTVVLLVAILMLVPCFTAIAEETATMLPLNVSFSMDYQAVLSTLGEDAVEDSWEKGVGSLLLSDCATGIGELNANSMGFQVDRGNSEKASRLSIISLELQLGDNCIAAFHEALATLTTLYGQPDSDPFDASGVQTYVESGSLYATWSKQDVIISLALNRLFQEDLSLDFMKRICYNADDLKV